LIWLHATVDQFRTGWFIESITSAAFIVLIVRTRRPFFRSRPSRLLALATVGTVVLTVLIPYLPFAAVLSFGIVPAHFYPILAVIIFGYITAAEVTKVLFYRRGAAS
jgi:P-type Mg2+ transporter